MMFENIGAFSAVFWALAVVLLLLILFEKKLIAFENKCIEARKAKIRDLEKVIAVQDKVIDLQHSNIRKLTKALSTQKKINSINLETLRQERLKNNREVKE